MNKRWLTLGVVWTVVFAGMSFYWAMGGMFGVRSLGGAIYEQSLDPDPSFILLVWLTGFVKLLGVLLLVLLLISWQNAFMNKMLYYLTKTGGILLFLYGLLNFITISMSAFDILAMDLTAYATFWRLVFWEPYWMIGGVCYFFSVKKA
ncbi:DUF3995 domain-containing protein [Gracilibacillus phocaeensis]|uniref:DUF3995 domain-containing protein n=1 Tax=Gracilibacillus phocaeensis TaxID=2042304 RepID=UPI002570483E|nr:DUF3995 domain-containing protein [Gracilibacillus phocaeensis]